MMEEVGVVAKFLGGAVSIIKNLYPYARERRERSRLAQEAKELLGLESPKRSNTISYRHDTMHMLYPDQKKLHPDNLETLINLTGDQISRAHSGNKLLEVEQLSAPLDSDLVLIGSPTSEGISRIVFGYTQSLNDPDSLIQSCPPVDLPYSWVLDKERLEGVTVKRMAHSNDSSVRPNWRIESRLGNKPFIPRVDAEDMLMTDYLLITKMRNFMSTDSIGKGRFIISVGGTHGTATKSVKLLLENESVLNELHPFLSKSHCYQILLEVSGIVHDKKFGTFAKKIRLADEPKVLDDNYDRWVTARQIANENKLKLWSNDK